MADPSLVGVGAAACVLSGVFGWIAMKTQREHRLWCARGARVYGVVSRLGKRGSHGLSEDAAGMPTDHSFITVPVVQFRAANGVEYEIDAPEAPNEIGAPVEVAYDPVLPSGGRAVARVPKIGVPVVLFLVGVTLVLIGLSR